MLKVFHSVCFLAFEEVFKIKTIYRNRQADYAKEKRSTDTGDKKKRGSLACATMLRKNE